MQICNMGVSSPLNNERWQACSNVQRLQYTDSPTPQSLVWNKEQSFSNLLNKASTVQVSI
jgi:hypothetical protein